MKAETKERAIHWCAALACCAALVGCAERRRSLTDLDDLGKISATDVMLVGRFEYLPPIGADEQDISLYGRQQGPTSIMRGKIDLYPAAEPTEIDPSSVNERRFINPRLNETFFMSWPGNKPNIGLAQVLSKRRMYSEYRCELGLLGCRWVDVVEREVVDLAGPIMIDIRPTDYILYVGTVKVYRDDDLIPVCMTVVNEYGAALELGRKRFGDAFGMRTALLDFSRSVWTPISESCNVVFDPADHRD